MKSYMAQIRLLGQKDFIDVGRETLNNVAIQSKRKDIPKFADDKFTVRRRHFFTAMTRVNYAKRSSDNTLDNMFSEVGFIKHRATAKMGIHEDGGTVDREIKPKNKSRAGNSYKKVVARRNMFDMPVSKMIRQSRVTKNGKTEKQRFVIALKIAEKRGDNYFLADEFKTIYKKVGSKWVGMYKFEKGNKEDLGSRKLMRDSAKESMSYLPRNFVKAAREKIDFRARKS